MATAMYLEHYLDSIEGLPFELQRNFSLMTDLDTRTEEKKVEIDLLACEYVEQVKKLSPEERVIHLKKIEVAYSKCQEFSDDKVQLAMQIYEMVDKHIRRLDTDLARFESELKDRGDTSLPESSDEKKNKKKRNLKERRGGIVREKKKSDDGSPKHKTQNNSAVLLDHSDVGDMPVDPNEPTYCLCAQVSYGEMIGCDNADCSIEWFHFACVSLTTKPKGEWFCPRCTQDMKKK